MAGPFEGATGLHRLIPMKHAIRNSAFPVSGLFVFLGGIAGISSVALIFYLIDQGGSLLLWLLVATVVMTSYFLLRSVFRAMFFSALFPATLVLDSVPAKIGERLIGTIQTWLPLPVDVEIRIELNCTETAQRHAPGKTRIVDNDVWDNSGMVTAQLVQTQSGFDSASILITALNDFRISMFKRTLAGQPLRETELVSLGGLNESSNQSLTSKKAQEIVNLAEKGTRSRIPVDILIPADLPPSGWRSNSYYKWSLVVHTSLPDDFSPVFVIPVKKRY